MKNQEGLKVGMVSIYPGREDNHPEMGGVASYTKNIVEKVSEEVSVTVYANKLDGEEDYIEDNTEVRRSWSKFFPFDLVNSIRKNGWNEDLYHIQHEYFLYGGFISAIMFPILLSILKIRGKPRITTIHGIMPLDKMNQQFMDDMGITFPSPTIARLGIKYLTKIIGLLSSRVIVHEDEFKQRLVDQYNFNTEKIEVIPHPVEKPKIEMGQQEARTELSIDQDKEVLLFFGYLTGYKGLENLIKTKNHLNDDYKLIIAGGAHPRRKGTEEYEEYIQSLKNLADNVKYSDIDFTGFVEEENIPKYFYAADLCILPYKYTLASSGPENLAKKFGAPVIKGENRVKEIVERVETSSHMNNQSKSSNVGKISQKTLKLYREVI